MNKLKIVWLCHFTSKEVQAKLPIWKKKNESAPWIPNMIKGIMGRNDIELHIISPHEYLKKNTSYSEDNIHFHFIHYGMPIIHRHWPAKFHYDVFSNFSTYRKKVKLAVEIIKPDLINLIGAENAYYSSAILDFKDQYPILISIQGFISQLKHVVGDSAAGGKKIEIEERILREFKYFCGEQDSSTYIKAYNPNHKFFKLVFAINEDLALSTFGNEKTYDCIYYGRLHKTKGTEEFIKVIAEIKKTIPHIKACIVGSGDAKPYKVIAEELGCTENIDFLGFMETQKELFEKVKESKVFLAPPLLERLSMTIREAMFLKVPIVAYATGGIPYINEFGENILMVKTGDYQAMAEKTILLLQNDKMREALSEKAYQYAQSEFSLKANTNRLLEAYYDIINKVNIGVADEL